MNENNKASKHIKSFSRRQGRLTDAQKKAINKLWQHYCLNRKDGLINVATLFAEEKQSITVEIGFGNGLSLARMAKENPQTGYIGIDVHLPGVGSLLQECDRLELSNVRCYHDDAVLVLNEAITDYSLDDAQIFFPDPWPKRRHHKRRLIQKNFVDLLCNKLKTGGRLHLATDWQHYAKHMMVTLSQCDKLVNLAGTDQFSSRSESRPLTKYEKRGHKLGHDVWDLLFIKQ